MKTAARDVPSRVAEACGFPSPRANVNRGALPVYSGSDLLDFEAALLLDAWM